MVISGTQDLHGSRPVDLGVARRLSLSLHLCSVLCCESFENTAECLSFIPILCPIVGETHSLKLMLTLESHSLKPVSGMSLKKKENEKPGSVLEWVLGKDKWFSGIIRVDQITF